MRIIDAHLHFMPGEKYFSVIARRAGHENKEEHLRKTYARLGISCGIVMGNYGIRPEDNVFPDFLRYCVGIHDTDLAAYDTKTACRYIEENLKRPNCVGLKLYPGYSPVYITDPCFDIVYDLAEKYNKPVAVHMGQTASSNALLRYSHPMTMDEAAVRHPRVQLVMCHLGNPFLMDAAAVIEKNPNVAADLSGLLERKFDVADYLDRQKGYVEALRTWIAYTEDYSRYMFGTDWPLANYENYIDVIKQVIPEEHRENVFSANAVRIYGLAENTENI
ncbi:MAG: amidohydrolase [Clostridium sp.]|nr:amidohydrolase [Clostridium sp.]